MTRNFPTAAKQKHVADASGLSIRAREDAIPGDHECMPTSCDKTVTSNPIALESTSSAAPLHYLDLVEEQQAAGHVGESVVVANDQGEDKTNASILCADTLIPGKGKPLSDHAVVIKDGKIAWTGPTTGIPSKYSNAPKTHVPFLMPGMWDCHVHLMGTTTLNFPEIMQTSPATAGARLSRSVHDILMSGFTSVRDVGGFACEISKPIEEGIIPGPHIYSAGAAISQTAGHGDVFELPIGWLYSRAGVGSFGGAGDADIAGRPLCIADGVEECRKAIRLQIRRGAKVIKILASGGVLSRDDDPHFQQFSDEEMAVMVREAGRFNRVVAAHVHGKPGIMAALKAGCRTLEHGTYLDDEAVDLMKEKDAMLIATRTIVVEATKHLDLIPPASRDKMKETAKYHKQAYELAIKRGVKIALGTDLGVSSPGEPLSHGRSGGELLYAVEAGMTPLEAIEAATANGPLSVGPMAPKTGQIKEGYDADVIALTKDPLEDIGCLRDVRNITHVWKRGELFKYPGKLA
ncbi:hypothetical protein LTS18_000018 [Coniosporium uncinatum]|uniref:Uncharacterized protein n=1 Tax=Coniosporium uncinatum TaxID=93489 RepID=A0ACC3DD78_9PEZI|nr:hypothetical protein LTS18_000018 [Coniosporium uncinatum]